MTRIATTTVLVLFAIRVFAGEHDGALRQLIADHGLQPLPVQETQNPALLQLGQSLFFDRELSGNRDTSCASCHHPATCTTDSRALPSGVGGEGLGPDRTQAEDREIVPRNAPEVFHRGLESWTSMFWDSRVATDETGQITSPAGSQLPTGLPDPLAVQAMFPVTSRAEMRGDAGDLDIHGQVNEIALIPDHDLTGIWQALTSRLTAIPAYQQAFQDAFPEVPVDELGFEHAAAAIGEFEAKTFSPTDSGWDRYLAGDDSALSESAKRGAVHFYSGSCASCHSGDLMTDQEHHNLGIPQFGPGKDASHLDVGRALETGESADEFAFRTPPLRNVTLSGPWMHNGAFTSLEDLIRHKFDPAASLDDYDVSQLPEHLQDSVRLDQATLDALKASLDPDLPIGEALDDEMVQDLMAFMASLTSPSADLMLQTIPDTVFSGLEVENLPASEIELLYNPDDGSLTFSGNESLELDGVFLRILEDDGELAGFEFAAGRAPWAADRDIVLSDSADAQSFVDYRSDPAMMFVVGDQIRSLLPSGLTVDEIADHLSAVYRVHGSPVMWPADVVGDSRAKQ